MNQLLDVGVLGLIALMLLGILIGMMRHAGTSTSATIHGLDTRLRALETATNGIASEIRHLKEAQTALTRTLDQFVAGSIEQFFDRGHRGNT